MTHQYLILTANQIAYCDANSIFVKEAHLFLRGELLRRALVKQVISIAKGDTAGKSST